MSSIFQRFTRKGGKSAPSPFPYRVKCAALPPHVGGAGEEDGGELGEELSFGPDRRVWRSTRNERRDARFSFARATARALDIRR